MSQLISTEGYSRSAGIATVDANNIPATWTATGTLDSLFSNTVDLPGYTHYRSIYVGVAGDLKINDWDGNVAVFKALPIGWHPIRPRRIFVTGTAATNVMGARLSPIDD